ncbi:MAG: hypothetical protein H6822_20610 [Planctomycetaceae bacterium]|nr:hypothetical protein [Planctomycetales bacterium]MCB9924593.1 hypothetical protein [Planctomycetaceae bacterium]
MSNADDEAPPNHVKLDELLSWVEFGCWAAIAFFPFLCWLNGPAVSSDQYVMRTILIVVVVLGAFALRFLNGMPKSGVGVSFSREHSSVESDVNHSEIESRPLG